MCCLFELQLQFNSFVFELQLQFNLFVLGTTNGSGGTNESSICVVCLTCNCNSIRSCLNCNCHSICSCLERQMRAEVLMRIPFVLFV